MIMSGGSSNSTAANPPTPSLSSLASSTPPSSDFIYVNGNMTNATPPMTVSSLDNNMQQVSLASISQSVTLEEALVRVSLLMRENAELKAVLQQNNQAMKEQCQVLSSVKHQWAAEREEMKHKFEQTRTVIMDLRRNVEDKEAKLIDLEGQLMAQRSDELIVTKEESPSLSAQMNSLRQRREEAEKQAELHSAQNKFLQKQTEKLNDKIAELIEAKSNLDSERVRLIEDNEKLTKECDELKKLTVKQQETQERLVKEKQELLTANNVLKEQVQQLTDQAISRAAEDEHLSPRPRRRHTETTGEVKTSGEGEEGTEKAGVSPGGEKGKYDAEQLADLETELDEEKRKITRLQIRLSEQNTLVQQLQREIHEKDELLAASKVELEKTVENLKKTHERQLEDLKSQLKMHPNYNEDIYALRAQVTSLVNELQASEQRLKDTNVEIEKYKHSCSELQARIILQEAEVSRQRDREDQLTADLRAKIASIEESLRQEKVDKNSKEVSLQELRHNFDQLCNDYHELLSRHEDIKANQTGGEINPAERRNLCEQIDNLTAQIITAEEALANKEAEIEELQDELRRAREEEIPVLKAQAEVYMGDFKAEREARERAHEEYERLKEELEQMYEQNYKLEEQIKAISVAGFREFHSRHAIPEEPELDAEGEDTTGNGATAGAGRLESDPGSQPSSPIADTPLMAAEDLICPMCNLKCPDYDTLRLHVTECIDATTHG